MRFMPYDQVVHHAVGGSCCHHPEPVEVRLNPTDNPLLVLRNVCFRRENRLILDNVDLTVCKGDFVAVTGPNGGGKTTLLRLILGLLKPSEGVIEFPASKPETGYLPQKNMVDSHFPITVREVIESGLLGCRGITKDERNERVDHTLRQIELPDLASRPIGRLSGGQLQRVLLGRALISRPALLALDEPLSYIDKHFEAHIYRLIAEIAPHTTILLVSHEMSMISSMANRHLLVDRKVTECASTTHFTPQPCC